MLCEASPIKRKRRTQTELDELLESANSIIDESDRQITIRHLFYRLVSAGAIDKTEREYSNLCHHLAKWRRDGSIEWDAFADTTRWHSVTRTYADAEQALQYTAEAYRKNLWIGQTAHVEIWAEKDAIKSILYGAANSWGVRTFTCRGFTSLSSLYSCAMEWKRRQESGKDIHVYYFGDHDASGLAIDASIERTLQDDFDIYVDLERVAVTPEQIALYDLPTRPQKKSDTRSRNFEGEAVEIDAMSPDVLCEIVEECITRHIDSHEWEQMQIAEQAEKETLGNLLGLFRGAQS